MLNTEASTWGRYKIMLNGFILMVLNLNDVLIIL